MNPEGIQEIIADRIYSFRAICALIPSSRAGRRLHLRTLHRWRAKGLFAAFRVGGSWYMHGSELLRLLHADEAPVWQGRTPAEWKRDQAAAERRARELGL